MHLRSVSQRCSYYVSGQQLCPGPPEDELEPGEDFQEPVWIQDNEGNNVCIEFGVLNAIMKGKGK